MKTINYQGQQIEASTVAYVYGTTTLNPFTEEFETNEWLCHDGQEYYLLRTINECKDNRREMVHRLSLRAAVLWATMRSNATGWQLRNDVNEVFDALNDENARDSDSPSGSIASLDGGIPTAAPQELETAQGEDQPALTHQLIIDIEPTLERCGFRVVVQSTEEQLAEIRTLAPHFGLGPREFLCQLVSRQLPGWPRGLPESHKVAELLRPEHLAFTCREPELAMRIERAAQVREISVDEFVADAVSGCVDMYEETMLVHPVTGKLLHGDVHELYTETDRTLTAPPLGKEKEPRWLRELAPVAPVLSVQLDAEAAKLLTRYLEETPWNLAAQDVVSGCLCTWIECALDNKEEAARLTGLANREEYHDGEWGYSQQAAADAMERRTGHRSELKDPNAPRTAGLGDPSEESSRRGVHDPEDMALLAASAPAAVQEHGSLAALVARRDAILREMASHDDQESDEAYNVRLDELNYLNRRIQEASGLPAHCDVPLFQQDKETSGDEQEGGK